MLLVKLVHSQIILALHFVSIRDHGERYHHRDSHLSCRLSDAFLILHISELHLTNALIRAIHHLHETLPGIHPTLG